MPQFQTDNLFRLLSIMARLRNPQIGCEWDKAQNFKTIAAYTLEEAYEVVDAIERNDMPALQDELGDLLLQVVFHACMAEEAGLFCFNDVAGSISKKLEQRHPHIFGQSDVTEEAQPLRWERIKEIERLSKGQESAMDGIALALPSLIRAEKLQKRAARQGFDWPDTDGPTKKVYEELQELREASTPQDQFEEAGDLLFAAVNCLRAYGISSEEALRSANLKFERRYRAMEVCALDESNRFSDLSLDEQEALWAKVKKQERLP